MKKYYLITVLFALIISCDDIPNSALIGKWQLKTVEKNGVESTVDTVWYNFQSEPVFAIQIYSPQNDTVYMTKGVRMQVDNVISIELESELLYLSLTDWDSANRSFTIDKVNRKNLVLLSEEGYRYSFIKF